MFVRGIDLANRASFWYGRDAAEGCKVVQMRRGRQVFCPQGWSCGDYCDVVLKAFEARTLLPRDRDYGPVLVFEVKQKQGRFLDPTERILKEELSKIDGILSNAGLQQVSGRKKDYPIKLVLLGAEPRQEQTITCIAKDVQSNCTH
jgi:hypothetical protein